MQSIYFYGILTIVGSLTAQRFSKEDIETNIDVLTRAINILMKEPSAIDLDIAVGLLIASENLKSIRIENTRWKSEILWLIQSCDLLVQGFISGDIGDDFHSSALIGPLSNLTLWSSILKPLKVLPSQVEERFVLSERMDDFSKLGKFSDDCILSVFQESCLESFQCWMTLNEEYSVPEMLHFLLFMQLHSAVGCEQTSTEDIGSFRDLKGTICTQILTHMAVKKSETLQDIDLFLESIALCGAIEGYVEFGGQAVQERFSIMGYFLDDCLGRGSNKKIAMSGVAVDGNIKEGQAEILVKPGTHVFYNPVQEFNRDLSICVLSLGVEEFLGKPVKGKNIDEANGEKRKIRVLEALSATGLRSIRYAKEVAGLSEIVANDLSSDAVESIKANLAHNEVTDLVQTSHCDAIDVMFNSRHYDKRFDAIDLDPYGCPSQFLDSAVQAVVDGGLLLVTCTDMAVLCGNTPETCYVKYGAISLRNKACHEMALRIVLQCIESQANRYKRYIVPLLSISADFYVRVFVRIFTSAVACKNTISKLSYVHQCVGCESITLQPLGTAKERTKPDGSKIIPKYSLPHGPAVSSNCVHCGSTHRLGGPIWSAPIHDPEFVEKLSDFVSKKQLGTQRRLEGVLSVVREELHDVPLYYSLDKLCSTVHATSMSMMTFRSALLNAGFQVSYSHAFALSIKTNAPVSVLWDIVRCWVKEHPIGEKKLKDIVAKTILSIPPATNIDFKLRRDANPASREMKFVRYQINPTRFWGPGTKASINVEQNEKKFRNQNKKRKAEKNEDSGEESLKKICNENT